MNKICILCNKQHLITNFYKENRAKDGLKSECIECFKKRRKIYIDKKRKYLDTLYIDNVFLSESKECIKCKNMVYMKLQLNQ